MIKFSQKGIASGGPLFTGEKGRKPAGVCGPRNPKVPRRCTSGRPPDLQAATSPSYQCVKPALCPANAPASFGGSCAKIRAYNAAQTAYFYSHWLSRGPGGAAPLVVLGVSRGGIETPSGVFSLARSTTSAQAPDPAPRRKRQGLLLPLRLLLKSKRRFRFE